MGFNERHIVCTFDPTSGTYDVWSSWGDETHQQRLFVSVLNCDYQISKAFHDLWTMLEARRTKV
jgi:hypothetical protein